MFAVEQSIAVDFAEGVVMEMVWCPPGRFVMGSTPDEPGRMDGERRHTVVLEEGFWISKYEVTVAQWNSVVYTNKIERSRRISLPKTKVSWNDCAGWIRKLNSSGVSSNLFFALPSEAQWEYACRAGDSRPFSGSGKLDDMGWYVFNSKHSLHVPGSKKPNQWGIFDMHGNAWEWCSDWFNEYPPLLSSADGAMEAYSRYAAFQHSCRGGSYEYTDDCCRSAMRNPQDPGKRDNDIGFRIVAKIKDRKQLTVTERIFAPEDGK